MQETTGSVYREVKTVELLDNGKKRLLYLTCGHQVERGARGTAPQRVRCFDCEAWASGLYTEPIYRNGVVETWNVKKQKPVFKIVHKEKYVVEFCPHCRHEAEHIKTTYPNGTFLKCKDCKKWHRQIARNAAKN